MFLPPGPTRAWFAMVLRPWAWTSRQGYELFPVWMFFVVSKVRPTSARIVRRALELAEVMRGLAPTKEEYAQLVKDLVVELSAAPPTPPDTASGPGS